MMFIDVQPFSLTSPIIGYGMAQNTVSSQKTGQDALRSWDSEQQRLLGGDGRRGDNEWLPMNLLVGSFVGSFVGLQLLPVNICQQKFLPRLKDLKGWTGDPNRLDASQMSQSRGAFTQRDAARSAPWPPLTISVGQEGPTNWESLGITWSHHQKLGYIYIYICIYIYMDLLWFKQLLAIGFKLNGCDSLSLYNYIYCTWRLFGGWCDFRDTLWPCSDVTFTDLMWLSRADMLGPAAKWSWWVLERSLQHGHPLVEGNVWKCCDRIKGRVQQYG